MSAFKSFKAKWLFQSARVGFLEDIAEVLIADVGGLQDKLLFLASRNAGKPVEAVYRSVYSVINSGGNISMALKPYFPAKEHAMLSAYDAGAANDVERGQGFLAVSKILGPIQQLKSSGLKLLGKAIFSGALVLSMWLGVAGGFAKDMTQLAPRSTWNPFSTAIISSGEWLANHYISTGIALSLLLGLLIWSFPNWTGERRSWADRKVPGFQIYREYRSSLTLIALASFIKSRQGFNASFKQVSESANAWEIWYLEKMRDNSTRLAGSSMLDVGFFDDRIINRLVMRDDVMPLEDSLEEVGLGQARIVVESMLKRLDASGKVADAVTKGFAGAIVVAVLLINLSAMSNLQKLH